VSGAASSKEEECMSTSCLSSGMSGDASAPAREEDIALRTRSREAGRGQRVTCAQHAADVCACLLFTVYIGTRALTISTPPLFAPPRTRGPQGPSSSAYGPLPCPAAISLSMSSFHLHFFSLGRSELVPLPVFRDAWLSSFAPIIPG
jgi:hypothetical protein